LDFGWISLSRVSLEFHLLIKEGLVPNFIGNMINF
jgi:hypothetical protein